MQRYIKINQEWSTNILDSQALNEGLESFTILNQMCLPSIVVEFDAYYMVN